MDYLSYIVAVGIAVMEIISHIDQNKKMDSSFPQTDMKSYHSYNAGMIFLIVAEIALFIKEIV